MYSLMLGILIASPMSRPEHEYADEPKSGMVVTQTDRGVRVSSINSGGLADVMGIATGDVIVGYTFNGTEKKISAPTDLKELLDAEPGKYRIVVQPRKGDLRTITGSLVKSKADPKTILFIPEKKK